MDNEISKDLCTFLSRSGGDGIFKFDSLIKKNQNSPFESSHYATFKSELSYLKIARQKLSVNFS